VRCVIDLELPRGMKDFDEQELAKRKGESQTVQVSSNRGSMPKGWNS